MFQLQALSGDVSGVVIHGPYSRLHTISMYQGSTDVSAIGIGKQIQSAFFAIGNRHLHFEMHRPYALPIPIGKILPSVDTWYVPGMYMVCTRL